MTLEPIHWLFAWVCRAEKQTETDAFSSHHKPTAQSTDRIVVLTSFTTFLKQTQLHLPGLHPQPASKPRQATSNATKHPLTSQPSCKGWAMSEEEALLYFFIINSQVPPFFSLLMVLYPWELNT